MTPEKITEKLDQIGHAHEEFKKAHEKELAEIKKTGQAAADRLEKVDRINTALTTLETELKDIKTALNRRKEDIEKNEDPNEAKRSDHSRLTDAFLRRGEVKMEQVRAKLASEGKVMTVDSDPDGGFLVSREMSAEIIKKVQETSPMRELCSVQTISSDGLELMQDLELEDAGWVGESEARPVTANATFKKIVIPAHEMYCMPKASQKLLDDASINVESWLAEKCGEKFGLLENTSFVSGNGVAKPKGILSYASGTGFDQLERYTAGSASGGGATNSFNDIDLIEIFYKLKEAYRTNSTWLMRRETIAIVRKLKDSSTGQYLWQPGLNGPAQSTILGRPVREAADLVAGVSSAAVGSVVFGDFKAGYQIVDRIGIRTIRDVYSSKPHVLFYSTKRVGGGVKNFEAIKIMVNKTG